MIVIIVDFIGNEATKHILSLLCVCVCLTCSLFVPYWGTINIYRTSSSRNIIFKFKHFLTSNLKRCWSFSKTKITLTSHFLFDFDALLHSFNQYPSKHRQNVCSLLFLVLLRLWRLSLKSVAYLCEYYCLVSYWFAFPGVSSTPFL